MKIIETAFEKTPWEQMLETLNPGESFSAAALLTLTMEQGEEFLECAFEDLDANGIALDVSDLPKMHGTGEAAIRLQREEKLVASGALFANLEENDPLRLYLGEIAAMPAAGDPALLAMACAEGDNAAMEQLTACMLSRVVEIACTMTGRGVLLLDLIQEGSLGLWQAISQYQQGDIYKLCDWWIRQYMAKAVVLQAQSSGIGQKLQQGMEDFRDVDQRLLSELGRNPTLEEIAEKMHITAEEAAVLEAMLTAARSRQQIESAREPAQETPEDDQAVEDTAYFQSRQRIMEMLSVLQEDEAQLLSLRFGLEGGVPLNPRQAGERLGLTEEEVVNREAAALAKLRRDSGIQS